MNVKEKIDQIKDKAARVAVKAAAVATLMTGASAISSCQENNRNTDENGEKIERTGGEKTSVVFRTFQDDHRYDSNKRILMENGDIITQDVTDGQDAAFLEPGDTVTYKGDNVKAIRYKNGAGKQVNFGKIGKISKDITD